MKTRHTIEMKRNLTVEQSDKLVKLGVDPSKASKYEVFGNTFYGRGIGENVKPIFTLADILELLPKEIKNVYGDPYGLNLNWDEDWEAAYFNVAQFMSCQGGILHGCTAPELIDALYELLVWCIDNKHIEI